MRLTGQLRPEVKVRINAATRDRHPLTPPDFSPGRPEPKPRDGPIRLRAKVMAPSEACDQIGFALTRPPPIASAEGVRVDGRSAHQKVAD
ncbi:MAG: hypothetical protein ACO3JG_16200 [Luteolibacter sp.]